MARTYRKNEKYATHPGDGSRKGYQRQVNKRLRAQGRWGIAQGLDALPVVRRQVDHLQH